MNLKEIKELINLMNENALSEIEIEKENGKIRLRKTAPEEKVRVVSDFKGIDQSKIPEEVVRGDEQTKEGLEEITSPIVGIFYRSSSPDAESFVNEGDDVVVDQVLCIIEAMKVMNEIKSDISGKIVKILVENGNPIEYNQPLFLVEKK